MGQDIPYSEFNSIYPSFIDSSPLLKKGCNVPPSEVYYPEVAFPVELSHQYSVCLAYDYSLQSCETRQFPKYHQTDQGLWFAHSNMQYNEIEILFLYSSLLGA